MTLFNLLYLQLDILEKDCHAMGTIWPTVFPGSTIKPKVDLLVFVVPKFARKWGTLGGLYLAL